MAVTDEQPQTAASQDLLARARAGDAPSFCRLIEPLQTRLLRQATALNGDASLAEDLVSETRVRAWKHFSRYNETCRLSTWLYAILLHCHQEAARRARSRPTSLARLPWSEARELYQQHERNSSSEPSPAEAAAQKETVLELNRCVEMLPVKQRDIIRLRFFEDASLPDMAGILGCSVGTVKSRLHNALEKLRRMKMNLRDRKGHSQL
ncbi:MAG TPA: sigma-70 family RNA polymerase sigma factor [Dongiaceae bacterium]|nr:sigma-70 family RNA polymerase sigma factor [Dongiaceae bacterium]